MTIRITPSGLESSIINFAAAELSFDEWARLANLPYRGEQLEMLAAVHEHYRRFGLGGNALVLTAALGREPRSLRQYIQGLARSPVGASAA